MLKTFLFLAPVALGGWYLANRDAAPAPAPGTETARAEATAAAPRKSAAECAALERQLLEGGGPGAAPAQGLEAIRRVNGAYREMQRQGCEPGRLRTSFEAPDNAMGRPNGTTPLPPGYPARPPQGTSFEPGRPMVDVGRNRSR